MNLVPTPQALQSKKVLVIGDIMLDTYHVGRVPRLAQESPSPVFVKKCTKSYLGAAANVALNLKHLGAEVFLIGQVGNDDEGCVVRHYLAKSGIESFTQRWFGTTHKERWLTQTTQVFRQDRDTDEPSEPLKAIFTNKVKEIVDGFDGVILSDYGKGMIFEDIVKAIPDEMFCAVDPFPANQNLYRMATLISPNGNERLAMSWSPPFFYRHIFVTLGDQGIHARSQGRYFDHEAICERPVCVVGAGDVVIACSTMALLNDWEFDQAAEFANSMAGEAVARPYTSCVKTPIEQAILEEVASV